MATTSKTISVKSAKNNYDFLIIVNVKDYDSVAKNIPCTADLYIRNNGTRFSSGGWTVSITADGTEHRDTNISLNSTSVAVSGGLYKIKSISFNVEPGKTSFNISAYISRSSYSSYDPGYCYLNGSISVPQVQSVWSIGSLAIPNVEGTFDLSITKYVSTYRNFVKITDLTQTTTVKTIDNATNGQSVQFTAAELNQIYTLDSNENSKQLTFYLDLYTYDENGTQIGSVQRLPVVAGLLNANPTIIYQAIEQNANVSTVLKGKETNYVVKNASILKFTITATALKGSTIKSVTVNDKVATLSSNVYEITLNNIDTETFNIVATDSRGNSTTTKVSKELLDYISLKINSFSFKRRSQISNEIFLTADISCYNGSINGINNTPIIKIRLGESSEYIELQDGFTFSNNKIIFKDYVIPQTIQYDKNGRLYLYVEDLFCEIQDAQIVGRGVYVFESGEHDFQINGKLLVADINRSNKVDVLEEIKKSNKEIIFTGVLLGGQSITVESHKRYLGIYAAITFSDYDGQQIIYYIVDTNPHSSSNPINGSGVGISYNEESGSNYYVSEVSFDTKTNKLTHSRIGYFKLGSSTFNNRNNNQNNPPSYYIYQIETFD